MIKCEHLSNDNCLIASQMAGIDIPTSEEACKACSESTVPHTKNYVTASLCRSICRQKQETPRISDDYLKSLLKVGIADTNVSSVYPVLGLGVGTELHKILKERGWNIETGCQCIPTLHKMNNEGVQWCRDNAQKIVNIMIAEWQRRHKYASYIMPRWALSMRANEFIELAIEQYGSNLKEKVDG